MQEWSCIVILKISETRENFTKKTRRGRRDSSFNKEPIIIPIEFPENKFQWLQFSFHGKSFTDVFYFFLIPRRYQLIPENEIFYTSNDIKDDDQDGRVLYPGPLDDVPKSRCKLNFCVCIPDVRFNFQSSTRTELWRVISVP